MSPISCATRTNVTIMLVATCSVAELFQITYVVNSDHVLRRIAYGLISCYVGLTKDIHLSIKDVVLLDRGDRFAFGIKHGSDGSRTVILFHVRGDADIVV